MLAVEPQAMEKNKAVMFVLVDINYFQNHLFGEAKSFEDTCALLHNFPVILVIKSFKPVLRHSELFAVLLPHCRGSASPQGTEVRREEEGLRR